MADVTLRRVTESDLPFFFEHQRDPDAIRMAALPPREWDEFVAHWTTIRADDRVTLATILCDGRVAGHLTTFDRSGVREVGYSLGRDFWGRGIATRALALFLEQVSERPLYARVARQNVASIRVLEKCGFEPSPVALPDLGDGVEEVVLTLD